MAKAAQQIWEKTKAAIADHTADYVVYLDEKDMSERKAEYQREVRGDQRKRVGENLARYWTNYKIPADFKPTDIASLHGVQVATLSDSGQITASSYNLN